MARLSALAVAAVLAAAADPVSPQETPFILEGLVITASPTPRAAGDVARLVTVLDGAELRAAGLTHLADALRGVPGLAVVRGGSFGAATSVFMRGGESDHVQVLVDGVQVNQPGGAFDFSGLTLESVERIEIVRGPASSLYGSDAMAGVIHVITRSGRGATRGDVSFRAGSFGRREGTLRIEGGGPSSGWALALERLRAEGVLRRNNDFANTALTANARLAPDSSTRVSVALRFADRVYHFPTDGAGAVTDDNAFTYGDESSVAVSASRRVSSAVEVVGTVTLAQHDGGTDDQPDSAADTLAYYGFTSLDHVRRATADLRLNVYGGPGVATVGVEWEQQRQRSFSESLSQWGPAAGRSERDRGNRAGYAHVTGARGALSFAAGGRLEDNDAFGRVASWNAEAGWQATPTTRVRASVGRAVKEPTFFENFAAGWVRGNPDLSPERAGSVEAGVERILAGGRLLVRGSWYEQRFRDLIQYLASPSSETDPNFVNVAEAAARGSEVGVEVREGSLRAGADWSWLLTEVVDAGVDEGPGADFVRGSRLLRRPTHTLNLHGSWAAAAGTVRVDVRGVGERDDRDFSAYPARRVELPRYATVDVGVEVPVARLRLAFRAENLLGARYEEVAGFPAPGRGFYLGGRVTFGGGT
ncbi:MAG: TonB-dependent receptor [Longimicrobiales bacterium]|nr:TonB-dependent receptor [Longimicrobiales bacterium]